MIVSHKPRRHATQSGQAIVLLALSMVGILAFAVLALDGGRYSAQRCAAQDAADMAALAGLYKYQTDTAKNNQAVVKQTNHIAEVNSVPDTDSTPNDGIPTFNGDATNNNWPIGLTMLANMSSITGIATALQKTRVRPFRWLPVSSTPSNSK